MVKSAGKDFANNYPTTTYKNFIINAPAASIAGPVVNAMLPARSRDKNMLYGSKYADHTQEPSHRPSCMHLVLPACVPLACMRACARISAALMLHAPALMLHAPALGYAADLCELVSPTNPHPRPHPHHLRYTTDLHEFVSPTNLPQKLGGSVPDGVQWRSK